MRAYNEVPATILSAQLTHKRTRDSILFRAIIFERYDGRFTIEYSQAPQMSEGAGFYYSDWLTDAGSFGEACDRVDDMCRMLEKAFDVRPW